QVINAGITTDEATYQTGGGYYTSSVGLTTLTEYTQTVWFNVARYDTDGDMHGYIELGASYQDLSDGSCSDILGFLGDIAGAVSGIAGGIFGALQQTCDQAH
ncbi:hypothetical protein LTS18_003406, partial [Coniosporium uncinatum]